MPRIRQQHKPYNYAATIAFACFVLLCGCEQTTTETTKPVAAKSIKTESERGPVKFTVELTPEKPRLSDEPKLKITIRAEKGVRIEKPPFGQALGDFLIRDFYEPASSIEEKFETTQQIYTLEPTRAGRLVIAPITVHFEDNRTDGDKQQHTIESEAITVEVVTMHGDDVPTLANLRPATGPLELPPKDNYWPIAICALVLVICATIIWKSRQRVIASAPELSPQELAVAELDEIIGSRLADSDVKEFYVELTGVVRRYIERTTGVHAPEQTTEEFLREIVDNTVFANEEQRRLQNFLESADLVKFAAFKPEGSDIDQSVQRAKQFIQWKRGASEVAV